jgi:hypothetical protein
LEFGAFTGGHDGETAVRHPYGRSVLEKGPGESGTRVTSRVPGEQIASAIALLPTGQSASPNTMAIENFVASASDDARGQIGMMSRWTESEFHQ